MLDPARGTRLVGCNPPLDPLVPRRPNSGKVQMVRASAAVIRDPRILSVWLQGDVTWRSSAQLRLISAVVIVGRQRCLSVLLQNYKAVSWPHLVRDDQPEQASGTPSTSTNVASL